MAHGLSSNDVQVQVEDDLSGVRTGIDDQAVAGILDIFAFGELAGDIKHVSYQFLILRFNFVNRWNMLIRHNQNMGGSYRVDIPKSGNLIISENFMVPGGKPLWVLDQVRANYPIAMQSAEFIGVLQVWLIAGVSPFFAISEGNHRSTQIYTDGG